MPENRNGAFNNTHDIDLVDFSPNREMEAIRHQEEIEREKRRRRAAQIRRAEMLRRRRIEQIKQTVFAWGVLIFAIIVVVALIMGVVSMFSSDDETKKSEPVVGEYASEEETKLLNELLSSKKAVFERDNAETSLMPHLVKMSGDIVSPEPYIVHGSELAILTDAYIWNGAFSDVEKIKTTVRDFPMYSNGYIWSSEKSMKSPVTKSYLYDTNAAFISAVCDICLWEGSTSFLDQVDMTGETSGDKSAGMKVGEKLNAVVSHFFDSDDYLNGGGVRYNETDGLVYVLTTDNNGGESGRPSNLFYNYRFGYLDTYNNLTFNVAMQKLASLYTLAGDKESASYFKKVAETNKKAISEKLYDKSLGRFVCYVDSNSSIYDYGFTAINLLAIDSGVATDEQAKSILSWINGERKIESDSVSQNNIMKNGVLPVFNTVKAKETSWDSVSGTFALGDTVQFGKYWLNGTMSALSGNYYMKADDKSSSDKAKKLVSVYKDGRFSLPSDENSEPKLYYALLASNAVKEIFGVSTDGKTLSVLPKIDGENVGICDIAYSNNRYDVLFHNSCVYVLSDYEEAVRLKIGSFAPECDVEVVTVEDGKISSTETLKSDNNGVVSLSKKLGNDIYIRLKEVQKEEK